MKQVKIRRDYNRDFKKVAGPTATANKKEHLASPYDLEIANNYMRNAFKIEVIMSLKEQRKHMPVKYKIKNINTEWQAQQNLHGDVKVSVSIFVLN